MEMAHTKPAPEAISIQVAAVVLMLSEKTIRRQIKSGALEAVRFGKQWRIPKDVLARRRHQRLDDVEPARQPATAAEDRLAQDVADLAALLRDD